MLVEYANSLLLSIKQTRVQFEKRRTKVGKLLTDMLLSIARGLKFFSAYYHCTENRRRNTPHLLWDVCMLCVPSICVFK